jgi:hypothetical protein
MTGGQSKILEFPDETELHNTGRDELQRFRKPLPTSSLSNSAK